MSDYAQGLPVRSEADGTDNRVQVKIVDALLPGSQQMQVDTDKAAKVLTTGHDGTGTNRTLLLSSTGQAHVLIDSVNADVTKILDPKKATAVAANASDTHTYTVTTSKTLQLRKIHCAASARAKWELKTGPAGSEVQRMVKYTTASTPFTDFDFSIDDLSIPVLSTQNVLIIATNTDNQAQDLYTLIQGEEA